MKNHSGQFFWHQAIAICLIALSTACSNVKSATNRAGSAPTNCFRGQLDVKFCDRTGDLVADPPTNPAEFVNPDTLVFAYTPLENPASYKEIWAEFIAHLEKVTGKKVSFFAVDSNLAQLKAMRDGRLHIAGFNTGSTPLAVNAAGFVPFAIMSAKDGSFGYQMEIITYNDSDIQKIEDIKGRQLAFTTETSNSGYKAPAALLKAEFGLKAGKDYKKAFSGMHDNSILGVQNKDYEAAAISNGVKIRMCARGVADCSQLRVLYTSPTFPTTAYGYSYNLEPKLVEKIQAAFFSFNWQGTRLEKEFSKHKQEQFLPVTYKDKWEIVRKIDETIGVKYQLK
ncbi:phosphate/phosphite/phosphonate ABC transporter substrate-binding protein [Nodularia sphaerocarpa]|uniref:phosphate/phosphite/phosphonate ABC transporter substrate-binding protein n=1 Tax=Nodularia sphaerocarpa TaxID=137816 RepID=UPI001EFAFCBF|nr:phosphate/phosphite/phosphonate ABC transporter substrate-binding protein [Nodularia sphaerocarpa]MDB9372966.1 phosphate/phosphite/phosphonate ABC transporter substrate-binding protein [Nodularia sphaerocarpa CS-585]MDB9379065.1 phosphate/phosphite/phosphonate ABC transporter substrate-binding protein [Nodularia sphaerocarpa CS-585A2]ULP71705.1 putative phosphite transport system-binding protein PtxB [Nodularia sphaerocarpa UHCC 0038]